VVRVLRALLPVRRLELLEPRELPVWVRRLSLASFPVWVPVLLQQVARRRHPLLSELLAVRLGRLQEMERLLVFLVLGYFVVVGLS